MTESHDPEDLIRLVVQGHTSEGEPFQRVYSTTDPAEAERFDFLFKGHENSLSRSELDEIVKEHFPHLNIRKDEVGNEISAVEELPETLPLGEGPYDEENNEQLLHRATLQRWKEWEEAKKRSGNEIVSNLPTYTALGVKGDLGYALAAAGGTFVAGIIGWRGYQQRRKLTETLKIWVEFKNNRALNPRQAFSILNERMNESGLLFSGINSKNFKPHPPELLDETFTQLAKSYGVWYDKKSLTEKITSIRLPDAEQRFKIAFWLHSSSVSDIFETASASCSVIGKYSFEQFKDLKRNPTSLSTWKKIGIGLLDTPGLTYDICKHHADSAGRWWKTKQHVDNHDGALKTNQPEDLQSLHIENVEAVRDKVDNHLLREVETTQQDFQNERRDGAWMLAAQAGETLFFGAHIHKAGTSAISMVQEHALDTPPQHEPETWMDHNEAAFGLSLFSIFMASGAYAHIGHEISSIRKTMKSQRAKVFEELYPEIAAQYRDRIENEDAPQQSAEI